MKKPKRRRAILREAYRVWGITWNGLPHIAEPRQRERGTYTLALVSACNGGHDFHPERPQ